MCVSRVFCFSLSMPLGWFTLGCPFVPYGHHMYAGLLPISVCFLLARLLYWCAFCTRCNLCFSLRAHRFSLVSLWLRIAFLYLEVRVFCGVLVSVTIVVVCVWHRVSFVVLLVFSLPPANQVIFSCTSVHCVSSVYLFVVALVTVALVMYHCYYVSLLLCMLFLAQCYCPDLLINTPFHKLYRTS